MCRSDLRKTNVTMEEEREELAGVPDLPAPEVKGGLGGNAILNNDPDEVQCRICLDDEETPDNPFLTPCKCIGSVRFIHLDCFRSWLSSKK